MKDFCIKLLRFYQRKISPLFPPKCRYYPTCSNYMLGAIERFGVVKGIWLGTRRLMRCNIFFPGGVDPVPQLSDRDIRRLERRAKKRGEEFKPE